MAGPLGERRGPDGGGSGDREGVGGRRDAAGTMQWRAREKELGAPVTGAPLRERIQVPELTDAHPELREQQLMEHPEGEALR